MDTAERVLKLMRYEHLKAKGLCIKCGRRPAAEGKAHCERCLKDRRPAAKAIPKAWPTGLYCYICGDTALPGRKVCGKH